MHRHHPHGDLMAISTPLTIFSIDNVADAPKKTLALARFHPPAEHDEVAYGWVNFDDMTDAEWRVSSPWKPAFFAMGFRNDERKIPASLFKLRRQEAEAKAMAETGKKYLSREAKREIAEQVRLLLMAKMEPTPKVIDCVWEPGMNVLFVATVPDRMREIVADYFPATFDIQSWRRTPGAWALKDKEVLQQDQFNIDFLQYLYRDYGLDMAVFGDGDEKVTVEAYPIQEAEESEAALEDGKIVTKVRIEFEHGRDGPTQLTIDSQGNLTGVKTPPVDVKDSDDNPDAFFLEKMYLLNGVDEWLRMRAEDFAETWRLNAG